MRAMEFHPNHKMHFDILQIGAGGNGGYLTQQLSKLLGNLSKNSAHTTFRYTIVDQDKVEDKNLQRQPFLPHDVGRNKAKVLSERYGKSYSFPIFAREEFVESVDALRDCFPSNSETYVLNQNRQLFRVLIGCVDNNASRKIFHKYFLQDYQLIYIDCGVEEVLTKGNEEDKRKSGYSGHCVVGVHYKGQMLAPVAGVFKNILKDKKSKLPSKSCGENIVSAPQRMQSNQYAALITMGYLTQILAERRLYHHYTNFNALTHSSRPVLIPGSENKREEAV